MCIPEEIINLDEFCVFKVTVQIVLGQHVAKGHTACDCENEMMQMKCKYCMEIKAAANKLQEKVLRSVCSLQSLLATQLFLMQLLLMVMV